jgi:hypothetical protein
VAEKIGRRDPGDRGTSHPGASRSFKGCLKRRFYMYWSAPIILQISLFPLPDLHGSGQFFHAYRQEGGKGREKSGRENLE